MESMSDSFISPEEPMRPIKRVEFEHLAAQGFFEDERVELLFGVVVPMTPPKPPHGEATYQVRRGLERLLGERAIVRDSSAFAASDISLPLPDVAVVANAAYWEQNPQRAFLIVEVSDASLRKDKGTKARLYGLAEVDEYWIVNLVDEVVEVYRDRHEGEWRTRSTHHRGETISPLAFPDVKLAVADVLPPIG